MTRINSLNYAVDDVFLPLYYIKVI